ncbi:hypothetical protein TVAG_413360 [Trichomonas vaginalis G3]|uniref:Uncharacterized protein n=1 Tax=Trichomonas vaginalis (strain ATCC PRA-98 / G3) TaxID=412133 RepID=A2F9G8_TRIV3|nr:hypothetical protein TVAGG3_1043850 [Trichomonas vaginalis G3]EAX98439.1 hypothetical protein TVAG_413360 [Trichomonas vaginalis G3]KAI5493727.1 hypothetical protein TVAGG3_1043850 [Trichomonas vaginalis G3]|eukprot:XP_001311369.1 hypothetical protein [Trichomonas vaginalis G3]
MLPGMVNYPPRHYFTVSAIVTVKNEFISVMQLLNAVRVQKDYDLEYTINNNIKLSEGYIGNYYDSITYKYDVLLTLHEKDDPKILIIRSVYYIGYNDDPRNRITVYKKCDPHSIKYQYIEELRRFDIAEWHKFVYYPFEKNAPNLDEYL